MKKKNLKGFTLIELIVVMTILLIILGAVMNLIKPVNQLFKSTKNADDTNDICSGVMLYLENNLRYATNITVLPDYEGVPQVTNGVVGTSSANQTKYTNVIIIDSNKTNVRGSYLNVFDKNATPSRRKGEYGQILSLNLNDAGGTLDISKVKAALNEDYYGDYSHDFKVNVTQDSAHRYYLTTDMTTYLPELDGDTYKFEKSVFNHERSFELKNVNLSTGCELKDYLNTVQSLNYTLYPQASAPGGSTTEQAAYYSTSKKYTYIFYTNVVPTTKPKYTLQILDRNGNKTTEFKVKNSEFVTDAQEELAKDSIEDTYTEYNPSTGSNETYQFVKFEECTGAGGFLGDYKFAPVTCDMQFKPIYMMISTSSPTNKVYFYSNYNSTLSYFDPAVELYSFWIDNSLDGEGNPAASYGTMQGSVTPAPAPEDKQFDGWFDSSGNAYDPAATYTTTMDYYYYASFSNRPKYTVSFEVDGASYGTPITDVYSGTLASSLTFPADPSKSGYNFLGWFTSSDAKPEGVTITGDTTFIAKFEEIPATPPEYTELTLTINYPTGSFNHLIAQPTTNGGDLWVGLTSSSYGMYYIDMSVTSGSTADIKVKFKTTQIPEFDLRIMQDWGSPMPLGNPINIKTSNFVGKSSASITIDASGNVTYS